jgi:hypothetical protein
MGPVVRSALRSHDEEFGLGVRIYVALTFLLSVQTDVCQLFIGHLWYFTSFTNEIPVGSKRRVRTPAVKEDKQQNTGRGRG